MKSDEHGAAVLESLIIGIALIVPLVWLLTVLASVHAAAMGTNSAVREAGIVIARSVGGADMTHVDNVISQALRNHGVDAEGGRLDIDAPAGFDRGALVEIAVSFQVQIFDPPFFGGSFGPSLTVRSRHLARVDPFRSR